MNKKEKIVVLGYGWVGQANALALAKMSYNVFFYDVVRPKYHYVEQYGELYKKIKPMNHPLQEDGKDTWYFVCVGDRVNKDGKQDIRLIENALKSIQSAKGGTILRSTILPQYLKNLNFNYCFPEFLHEKYAVKECLNPHYFVIGKNKGFSGGEPSFFKELEKRAEKVFKGTIEQASYIKYLSNVWNALRIAFVNELGDILIKELGNQSIKGKGVESIIDFVFEKQSYLRYGKAFGGHCLPKDLRAFFLSHASKNNVSLCEAVYKSNIVHQRKHKKLPEWFSAWE